MGQRVINVSRQDGGKTVGALLHAAFPGQARVLIKGARVQINRWVCRNLNQRVRAGDRIQVDTSALKKAAPRKEPRSAAGQPRNARTRARRKPRFNIRVVHWDDDLIVVDKPAGMTTVRHRSEVDELGAKAKRFLPPSLVDLLPRVLPGEARRGRVRAVHRLDRDTTGLLVLARTPKAESHLGKQFRGHTVQRCYIALVRGAAQDQRLESRIAADRGDGRRGSSDDPKAQRAITHIRVLERLGAFSLVECRLETGRTHQVRVHLGEQGTPLCGEKVYDRPLHGKPLPDESGASRPMLHAAELVLDHPTTGQRLHWEAGLPDDMRDLLAKLRVRKHTENVASPTP
jgi:23S rRNA pseudouridine1911/1915/1917 synthase